MPRSKAVAERIDTHLKRLERDPVVNTPDSKYKTRRFYNARAYANGGRVSVVYVSYQGRSVLTIADAERYADALDRGYTGKHHRLDRWEAK